MKELPSNLVHKQKQVSSSSSRQQLVASSQQLVVEQWGPKFIFHFSAGDRGFRISDFGKFIIGYSIIYIMHIHHVARCTHEKTGMRMGQEFRIQEFRNLRIQDLGFRHRHRHRHGEQEQGQQQNISYIVHTYIEPQPHHEPRS